MRLRELLDGVETLGVRGDDEVDVTDVAHDSRRVVPGTLFCCVPGERADGHDFAADAVRDGAVALAVERWLDVPPPLPQVRLVKVRDAMGTLAARVHGFPSHALSVLGVTGTNGKTTTTYLLESIASAAGSASAVIGTIETRVKGSPLPGALTTPEAPELQALLARMRDEGVSVVAMEVSSHALALGRVDGTWFRVVTFLNLSHDHLDFHGSLEAYFAAKLRLFDEGRAASAAVNVGDEWGAKVADHCRAVGLPLLTFSAGGAPADVSAREVEYTPDGTNFELTMSGGSFAVRSRLVGPFNLVNSLAAAATAVAAGLGAEAIVAGLEAPVRVPGRFEPIDRGQPFVVVVDYAHTPDALAHALAAAREVAGRGRVLVVFGCGGDRDRAKRPVMGRVAVEGADAVYVTSDNPRREDPDAIIEAVVAGMPGVATVEVVPDRREAIAQVLQAAQPGDVVVVAGKGHEPGQIVGDQVLPFDDRTVVAEELERLPQEKNTCT